MANTIPIELHVFHEYEHDKARQLLADVGAQNVNWFEGTVRAQVRPENVGDLIQSGLLCNFPSGIDPDAPQLAADSAESAAVPLDAPLERALSSFAQRSRKLKRGTRGFTTLKRKRRKHDPTIDGINVEGLGFESVKSTSFGLPIAEARLPKDTYVIRTAGQLQPDDVEALRSAGAEIAGPQGDRQWRAQIAADDVEKVQKLDGVLGVRRYGLRDTVTRDLVEVMLKVEEGRLESTEQEDLFDCTTHRPDDLNDIVQLAESGGAEIVEQGASSFRMKVAADSPVLSALANHPAVRLLAPYVRPTFDVDHCRVMLGVDVAPPPPDQWTGEGETVAVFDSGVDTTHPDLTGAIARQARSGSSDDRVGHGTHVCGILAGSGAASQGKYRGVAPRARLVCFGITDANDRPDIPPDLGELLAKAIHELDDANQPLDAKVINLSWGIPYLGDYEIQGEQIDRFVYENPQVLVVVAAGNRGAAPDGHYSPSTISVPANAKNVLTVGASCSDRNGLDITFGQLPGGQFPLPPIRDQPICGDADFLAAISGRGPTRRRAVKPDVVAPGTAIVSARAARGTMVYLRVGAQLSPGDKYAYLNGTSMAAPAVAGLAALVRQFVRVKHALANPSAALVKAILIGCTTPLKNAETFGAWTGVGYPDFHQGYGRPDMTQLLTENASCRLAFVDVANDSADAIASHQPIGSPRKSYHVYRLPIPDDAEGPLRIVLAWTDVPSPGVYNNLSLHLEMPDGKRVVGNHQHRGALPPFLLDADPLPDNVLPEETNNVKVIKLAPPLPQGNYRVSVKAFDTPRGPQGYSLAALGPFRQNFENVL